MNFEDSPLLDVAFEIIVSSMNKIALSQIGTNQFRSCEIVAQTTVTLSGSQIKKTCVWSLR